MTGAQARDFALVVRATLLVRAQEFADRLGARGRQIGGYGMSATPPAGAMSGSRRTGLASPGRSSSPRRLGSASSKRCRCSGQSATVAENTLLRMAPGRWPMDHVSQVQHWRQGDQHRHLLRPPWRNQVRLWGPPTRPTFLLFLFTW